MPNFIDDDTPLPDAKVDRRPLPPGASANQFEQASDWNAVFGALEDTRDAIQALQSAGSTTNKLNFGFGVAPAALAASPSETADWDPWSSGTRYSLVRVQTATAGSILKSLAGGTQGDIVVLENHGDGSGVYGSSDLLIRHHKTGDPGITAGNNIYCPNVSDVIIPYTGSAILYYDSNTTGWIMLGMSTGDRHLRLVAHDFALAEPMSPTTLSAGNNNDYDPSGGQFGDGIKTTSWLRLLANASGSTLTGLKQYAQTDTGSIKVITCQGNALTLAHEDANSSAGNRFNFPGGKNITLKANQSVILIYDLFGGALTQARWRLIGASDGSFTTLTLMTHATPAQFAATQNDWNPTGWKNTSVWRCTPNPTNLTGMQEIEAGAIRVLTSYGSGLTIKHQSASSSSRNRFYNPGAADFTLNTGDSATFRYDADFGAWFCIGWTK